jgi:hypothetical protein
VTGQADRRAAATLRAEALVNSNWSPQNEFWSPSLLQSAKKPKQFKRAYSAQVRSAFSFESSHPNGLVAQKPPCNVPARVDLNRVVSVTHNPKKISESWSKSVGWQPLGA